MNNLSATTILLYVAIAGFVFYKVIYKQLKGSMLSVRGLIAVPAILLLLGAYFTVKVLPISSPAEIAVLGGDLIVLAVLGAARSASTKLSLRHGYAFQKGSATTLLLWVATIGVRVGFLAVGTAVGATGPLASASIMLTLGVSIGLQNALTYGRVRRLGLRIAADQRELSLIGS